MKHPNLERYETDRLESMLYSYRALARDHLDKGHYALAAWATRMVTLITIEMNRREVAAQEQKTAQFTIEEFLKDAS